ncbi:hypothetical protein Emed_005821 [Eimeria media]
MAADDCNLRWTLQATGSAASVPLPALLKAVATVEGDIHDCRLSLFDSLAVLNVSLSLRQGTEEELRQKLVAVTSQTKWHVSLYPEVINVINSGSTQLGPRCSSSSCYGTLDGPESFCLRVLLPGQLLPSSLLAAICQVLEKHRFCVLSSETEKTFPLLGSPKKRRLLLKISYRLPAGAPSHWSHLSCVLQDLRSLLSESRGLPWALSRSCFTRQSKLNALAKLQLRPQQGSEAEAATGSIATPAAAEHVPALTVVHVGWPVAPSRILAVLHAPSGGQEKPQQRAVSKHVEEESSYRQILAIISTDLPTSACDVYATTPPPGEEDALLPLLGLRFWEVRLFAKSCVFLAASRRARTSVSRNYDNSSSSDSSSDSGSDAELECTDGSSCLPVGERVYSLPNSTPWWSDSVLDTMKHKRGEPAEGHEQLQAEEAEGRPCEVNTAAEPAEVDVVPLSAQGSSAQTSCKCSGNCSCHSGSNSGHHQSSSSPISIPCKGGTEIARSTGGKTYELLLVQQPQLTSRFVSEAAAAAEAAGARIKGKLLSRDELHSACFHAVPHQNALLLFANIHAICVARACKARLQQVALGRSAVVGSYSAAGATPSHASTSSAQAAAVPSGSVFLFQKTELISCYGGAASRVSAFSWFASTWASLSNVSRRLTLTEGGLALCRLLKARGIFLAILSGGFTFFAEEIKQKLQVDYIAANLLSFTQEGQLTGEAHDPIVTPEEKRRILLLLSEKQQQRWQLQLEAAAAAGPKVAKAAAAVAATEAAGFNAAAIGDGSNDILMLRAAKTGIAFCAKENVRAKVPIHLQARNLWLAAYFLGIYDPVSP